MRALRLAACLAGLAISFAGGPALADAGGRSGGPMYDAARGGDTIDCDAGAECTASATADRSTGAAATTADYKRPSAGPSRRESAYGHAQVIVHQNVPREATRVVATYQWLVNSASASATSTSGQLSGYAGVGGFAEGCSDGCTTTAVFREVRGVTSAEGSAPFTRGSEQKQVVTFTVTASGDLPKRLEWHGLAYAVAAGEATSACPPDLACLGLPRRHAGTSSARIDATLLSLELTTSRDAT